tara:strand:+ start:2758 stop:2955 length:198 start_codon:yes stop_codon:yes gene_type:complete
MKPKQWILNNEVTDWLDTYYGESPGTLVICIANNEIKTEVMIDSIYAFSIGETEIAEQCFKDMWR